MTVAVPPAAPRGLRVERPWEGPIYARLTWERSDDPLGSVTVIFSAGLIVAVVLPHVTTWVDRETRGPYSICFMDRFGTASTTVSEET